ncbi:hypothetical protein BDV97DRAFT_371000 [Delphinella strobiligena]|nr:hypothetical protein BDV97DRAFT_371000 [Delphinella strobiligena]
MVALACRVRVVPARGGFSIVASQVEIEVSGLFCLVVFFSEACLPAFTPKTIEISQNAVEELAAAVEELAVAVEKWSESAHKNDESSMSAFLWGFCITTFFLGIGFVIFQDVVDKYYKKVRTPVCKLLLISLDVLLWVFCPVLRALRWVIMFVPCLEPDRTHEGKR